MHDLFQGKQKRFIEQLSLLQEVASLGMKLFGKVFRDRNGKKGSRAEKNTFLTFVAFKRRIFGNRSIFSINTLLHLKQQKAFKALESLSSHKKDIQA